MCYEESVRDKLTNRNHKVLLYSKLHVWYLIKHDVLRLYVSMDDVVRV